ncbi:Sodium bicarbonate transporter-like protein 11 [Trichinella nativa]|uniref:Sodium bicarbonate transporter-like protein 11 n=1 Tax=Trichinella nativa TaxID=6335 RepID=A0A0V1KQY0_9BILA|nr:Sodium bicarbonate transporter-like protein 11 [Trichinella nativa]
MIIMHAGCEQETQRRRCSSTTDVAKSNLPNTENEDADTLLKPLFPSGRIALASSSTLLYSTPPKPSLESFQSSSSTALNTYSLRRPRTSQVEPGECLVETHLHQPGHTHRTNSMNRHETGQKYLTITNSTVSRSSIDLFDEDSINDFDDAEGEEFEKMTLMYAKHEKIPMKDFGSEVRATMDIDHLLNKAVLLLDLPETSLEEIFNKIIHEMDIQEPEFTSEQVKNALFTQDAAIHILTRTVQSICTTNIAGSFDFDQTWICAICMLPTVQHRHVAITRLIHPTNLGRTMQDLRFIIIVIAPSRAKGTKTALETARTFATLFADLDIRQRLVMAQGEEQFRQTMLMAAKELAVEQNQYRDRNLSLHLSDAKEKLIGPNRWYFGRGLKENFCRRLPLYLSDYVDGIRGPKTVQKLLSTVVFLYFACLLPSIAFGVLNHDNTHGAMVIYQISKEFDLEFFALYACVGLWCQLFLVIYAHMELSNVMKWATRSTEEIFSLFIAVAFVVEAFKALSNTCQMNNATASLNFSSVKSPQTVYVKECHRETSILYLLLMFGTLWLGLFIYNFRKTWATPYLTRAKREILADYALPMAVIVMSFTGAYCFREVKIERFHFNPRQPIGTIAAIRLLPVGAILASMGLGFCLSILFFLDQNITSAIVNNQKNKLRKGSTTHLDLLVVAILNVFLSLYGLPWMHAALPHSPLHLRALADVEERVSQGHVHEVITYVRETRLATLLSHCLIGVSALLLLPMPLQLIPRSVLDGLFLYMAVTSLNGNEMFERILLLLTEQAAYPPTHYIRRVPQRKIHLFTICQLIQLILLCSFGLAPYPYIEMIFPVICFSFFPIRQAFANTSPD